MVGQGTRFLRYESINILKIQEIVVAVVSLSRIQVRRGRKSQDGMPQLASGELAWAIDSQELYIGNGSLSEGAPTVGNTKIITEHDNIFELTESYYYGRTVETTYDEYGHIVKTYDDIPDIVPRSLQARLDDYVSLRAFGAKGDSTDHSDILQKAINQLFKQDTQARTSALTLYVEPGTYVISQTITLPPRTQIQGAGAGRTIFKIADNVDTPFTEIFKTVEEDFVGENNNIEFRYPKNLLINNITVDVSSASNTSKTIFHIEGATHSKFSNIELIGDFVNLIHKAFYIKNAVFGDDYMMSKHNIIENTTFNFFENAIYSPSNIHNNTIRNCIFENNILSVLFDDTQSFDLEGAKGNIIENCWFDAVSQQAIKIVKGTGNVSRNNKYNNVGNIPSGEGTYIPYYPVIEFGSPSNNSDGDWFLRTYDLMYSETLPYIPEVKGISIYESKFRYQKSIGEYDIPTKIINLSVSGYQTIEIQYTYKSNQYDAFRSGTLTINANAITGNVSINDDFNYVGDTLYLDNINFITQNYNNSGSFQYAIDTLGILMLNSTNNDNADFHYSIKYIN